MNNVSVSLQFLDVIDACSLHACSYISDYHQVKLSRYAILHLYWMTIPRYIIEHTNYHSLKTGRCPVNPMA